MRSLPDIEKEVDRLRDRLDEPVDKEIRHTVAALRYAGFNTTASCAGHLDRGFPYPWVDIAYTDGALRRRERKRLKQLLKQFHKIHQFEHPLLIQKFADFRLQNVKWPRRAKKRRAHIDTPDRELLAQYREEMDAFADFLIASTRGS